MSYTFSELLQDAYMELGQLRRGQASGGSASTLADAELAGQHREDDWKGGAVFLAAGGGPPAGEFARVAGFVASSGTLALASSLSEPVEAGMAYGLASAQYPLPTMLELANSALRGLGDVPQVDEDVLPSSAHTLAWVRRRPLRIDYLAIPGVSAGDPWRTLHDWDYVPTNAGQPGLVLFADPLPAGRPLRVWYLAAHPRLAAHDDMLAEAIAPELAVAAVAERALRWQCARRGGDEKLALLWQDAVEELQAARRRFPIWRPQRPARLLRLRGQA
ncbi:MAG: hypothetical protein KIT70_11005 [Anaerolineales bacterium]|nr:MAG: hypothetical protein KIT70_11005 [Anaerolineales bacterium]